MSEADTKDEAKATEQTKVEMPEEQAEQQTAEKKVKLFRGLLPGQRNAPCLTPWSHLQAIDVPQPPPLRSGWSMVVKGKQSQSIASKPTIKQHASKADKAATAVNDAATEASHSTSVSSHASPSKGKQSSSEVSSSSSSGVSKGSTSVQSEQQVDADKPKSRSVASSESDKAAVAAEETAGATDTTEVRLHSVAAQCAEEFQQQRGVPSLGSVVPYMCSIGSFACCRARKGSQKASSPPSQPSRPGTRCVIGFIYLTAESMGPAPA